MVEYEQQYKIASDNVNWWIQFLSVSLYGYLMFQKACNLEKKLKFSKSNADLVNLEIGPPQKNS
jgi:hypothetical protein